MKIRSLTNSEKADYNELALNCGTVFNTIEWLELFGDKVQIYGIYDKGDNLIGGFHLYREKRFGFTLYRNPMFTPNIGPFLQIKAKNHVSVMNTWKKALGLVAGFLDKLPCSVLTVTLDKSIVDTQPFFWKAFKVVPGYTYLLNLAESVETIQKNMSAERRNDIKKATKDGLVAKQISDFKIAKSLVLRTLARQQVSVSEQYLDKILFSFANENNSIAFVCFDDKTPIATAFCVLDNKMAYYILGGYDERQRHHGAGALAVWESIKYSQEIGLQYFDFEGSMVPQIEKYFRGFGGQLTPYYRVNKAKLHLEVLLKFVKRELF